jgi:Tfp pilus assembly protein PilX
MRRDERGMALLLCILSLMVLTALAVGLMYMTNSETMVNNNYKSSEQAYFAALAGLQNVRERMSPASTGAHAIANLPTTMPGNPNSILYVLNPRNASDTVSLSVIQDNTTKYYDGELCTELTGQGQACSVAAGSSTTAIEDPPSYGGASTVPAMGMLNYKWVRVNLKANGATAPYYTNASNAVATKATQVCWDGSHEVLLGGAVAACSNAASALYTPVYQLTSLAVTPLGATRMAQMEAALQPPLNTHAAIDSQDHVTLNGKLDLYGYDYCSCKCTSFDNQGNCTGSWQDANGRTCDRSKYAIYSAQTVDSVTSSQVFESGLGNGNNAVAQNQPWPWDLNALISNYKNNPSTVNVTQSPYNWNCTGGSCGNRSNVQLGTLPATPPTTPINPSSPPSGYQITYVPGDVHITSNNSQGFGVLIVDGNLDLNGGFAFDGLIIVTGVISFTGGGSDGVNIYGGVIAGQQSLVDNVLGGSVTVNYDQCALPQRDDTQPPKILSLRELNF